MRRTLHSWAEASLGCQKCTQIFTLIFRKSYLTNLFRLRGKGEEALELGREKKLKGVLTFSPSRMLPRFLPLYLANRSLLSRLERSSAPWHTPESPIFIPASFLLTRRWMSARSMVS